MTTVEQTSYVSFEEKMHLPGVLRLCEEEGWNVFSSDPELAGAALRAPGVTTVVAVHDGAVVGFAQMQSDGVWQAHLSLLLVDESVRRRGAGRRLVEEAFARCGAERVDLICTPGAEGFYESFAHKAWSGYRIYPRGERGDA